MVVADVAGIAQDAFHFAVEALGFAMGPFAVSDLSGLDIAFAMRRRRDATRSPHERYVAIPDRLVNAGRLGRKTGAGYYRYDEGFMPPFEGVDRFKGRLIHPQSWPEDLDYSGKRVVIIGGGDCGTLKEVLRHPGVEKVTQIDIDEEVTKAAERFFPELVEANGDPRAELLFADGVSDRAARAVAWLSEGRRPGAATPGGGA